MPPEDAHTPWPAPSAARASGRRSAAVPVPSSDSPPGDDHQVGLPGRGPEYLHAEPGQVVPGCTGRHHLDRAAANRSAGQSEDLRVQLTTSPRWPGPFGSFSLGHWSTSQLPSPVRPRRPRRRRSTGPQVLALAGHLRVGLLRDRDDDDRCTPVRPGPVSAWRYSGPRPGRPT